MRRGVEPHRRRGEGLPRGCKGPALRRGAEADPGDLASPGRGSRAPLDRRRPAPRRGERQGFARAERRYSSSSSMPSCCGGTRFRYVRTRSGCWWPSTSHQKVADRARSTQSRTRTACRGGSAADPGPATADATVRVGRPAAGASSRRKHQRQAGVTRGGCGARPGAWAPTSLDGAHGADGSAPHPPGRRPPRAPAWT
jgi:hypothetical protein